MREQFDYIMAGSLFYL